MQMKERQAIAKLEEANIQIHTLLKELSSNARVKNEPELIESIRLEVRKLFITVSNGFFYPNIRTKMNQTVIHFVC